jgi:hypothetical protein
MTVKLRQGRSWGKLLRRSRISEGKRRRLTSAKSVMTAAWPSGSSSRFRDEGFKTLKGDGCQGAPAAPFVWPLPRLSSTTDRHPVI